MSPKLQVTAVWMTAAILLAQAVFPSLAFGCGCRHICSADSRSQEICCRTGATHSEPKEACPHCGPPAGAAEPGGEFLRDSVCRCGDSAPLIPAEQMIPESSKSTFKHFFDLIVGNDISWTTKVALASTPAPPPMPLSEDPTHNDKQALLCVWLT